MSLFNIVPSLDTPVCDPQTRRFNQEAGKLGEKVAIVTVSMDLPPAQERWCQAASVKNVITALISLFTQLPIDSARVDFVDQEIYSTKAVSQLWLDPDSNPNGLVLQKAPSAELRAIAESKGIDLTDHGTSYFRLYNPDQLTLSLRDSGGLLALSQIQIGPTDWQPLISVAATAPLPIPYFLEVLGPASDVIKQLEVFELDFKLFPVSFWYMHPLDPDDYEFDEILAALNRILGRQANAFCYPAISIGNDARSQALHITILKTRTSRYS